MTQHVPPLPAASAQDESICFEAHGLLNQSYDALNTLLLDITHVAPVEHAAVPEVTIVGQADTLLAAHLFL
jgi:hypothetical protein